MGQVIELRRANVRQDMVEHYETMLARARCGTAEGSIDFVNMSDGKQYLAVSGSFADDTDLALKVAQRAVNMLRQKANQKKNDDSESVHMDYVPARLRGT